ncbi:hypothetical protein [Ruegeria sp. EL01]|uniref:hypothetical protein n=1 Tax=Ruegeria sp. EL01 TaxID=2107578 RepID=UPI000EA83201|nr:hypothetical protein [Ruegeria sp. EL01]
MSPLYVKEETIAKMLGHNVTWLRSNAVALERQYGLPPIDPAVGMRHVEAVEEWARERNIRKSERPERLSETNQEDLNAF